MFKRKTTIPVLFWYFEYVCACVCMVICICKCGCMYVYLYMYIDSIFKWILHIMWTHQRLYKYICSSIVDMSI